MNLVDSRFHLSDNNIGVEGGKAIGEALKSEYLSLEGGKAIGEALKVNTSCEIYRSDFNNHSCVLI